MLKSRHVVPTRLVKSGFRFAFPEWPPAADYLIGRGAGIASLARHGDPGGLSVRR